METLEITSFNKIVLLKSKTKDAILKTLVGEASEYIPNYTKSELLEKVLGREALANTSIGKGIAIPHARLEMDTASVIVLKLRALTTVSSDVWRQDSSKLSSNRRLSCPAAATSLRH